MAKQNNAGARDLAEARHDYLRDMKWMRARFGIIPEVHRSQLVGCLTAALDALESGTPEAGAAAVESFRNLHRAVMKEAVWHVLEQTKRTLKALRGSEPDLCAEKLELWNRASWLFTNFSVRQSRTVGGNYRKALDLLAGM